MRWPDSLKRIGQLRERRKRRAAEAVSRHEKHVAQAEHEWHQCQHALRDVENRKAALYVGLPSELTRACLYRLKQREASLEQQRIELLVDERAMAMAVQHARRDHEAAQDEAAIAARRQAGIDQLCQRQATARAIDQTTKEELEVEERNAKN